jgi:hypothetical protein
MEEAKVLKRAGLTLGMRKLVVLAGLCGLLALSVVAPPGWAAPPVGFSCNQSATVCHFSELNTYGPVDTGIVCGSGASAFDIFDRGTQSVHGTVWFDRNGKVIKIFDLLDYTGGVWSNPLTGHVVTYTQHNTETIVPAVPGDPTTATVTITGENIYQLASGTGKPLFFALGRQVFNATGDLIWSTPNNGFVAAFFEGDTHAFDRVCAALG